MHVLAGLFALTLAAGVELPGYAGTKAERRASDEGYRPLRSLEIGSGVAVVERRGAGLYLSWLRADRRRLRRQLRLGPWPGELDRFAPAELRPGQVGLLLVTVDAAPDEVVHQVRVWSVASDGLRPTFDRSFVLPKQRQDRAERSYGDADPKLLYRQADSGLEIVWVRGPRILEVPGRQGPVPVTIGADASRFAVRNDQLEEVDPRHYIDFVPAHPVAEVEATQQLPQVWGTAQAFWATDGDPKTSWSLPAARRWSDALLTARFRNAVKVRMIRWVPGCARGASEWSANQQLRAVQIDLGGRLELRLDRTTPDEVPSGVLAWGEFPLFEGFGRQVVVFLEQPRTVSWVRIRAESSMGGARGAEAACLSELSFH